MNKLAPVLATLLVTGGAANAQPENDVCADFVERARPFFMEASFVVSQKLKAQVGAAIEPGEEIEGLAEVAMDTGFAILSDGKVNYGCTDEQYKQVLKPN
ncbi:MAG: hypothetical protein H6868_05850 [Rhodospirillales bacterium]|nr:hypothetical protein [Rhodospirillales bacterium]